ncbi:hypothetical protein [Flavobacterium sp. HTF]|uniref:hypothetical protein n=1 Tax=Flavobacterium sp. HTF TaxID=2170732 RepID=UPI000D5E9BD8|nr:hypothetical protein [Flavobacterium sp. HTF]PWB23447.1 hypothetical protein DCO46_14460 [Flavobacterium sp. HTF]
MKHLFKILFISLLLISCSNNEDNTENNDNEPVLKKINLDVTNQSNSAINPSEISFDFEYDNEKKLIKKNGGYIDISHSTGYSKRFINEVYTLLTYTNNNVTVENFTTLVDFTIPKSSVYYSLNSSNQILQKEVPNVYNNVHSKKLVFKYSKGKLIEILTSFPNMPYDLNDPTDYVITYSEKFYYDANSNLVKTEYFEQHNGINEGERIVRTFEDYDNSPNPFKRLRFLEEYFYRSLSKNNFRKYTETKYYYDDMNTQMLKWEFVYDANGQIILGKN